MQNTNFPTQLNSNVVLSDADYMQTLSSPIVFFLFSGYVSALMLDQNIILCVMVSGDSPAPLQKLHHQYILAWKLEFELLYLK